MTWRQGVHRLVLALSVLASCQEGTNAKVSPESTSEPPVSEEPTVPETTPESPPPLPQPGQGSMGCAADGQNKILFEWSTGGCLAGGNALVTVRLDGCADFFVNGDNRPGHPPTSSVVLGSEELGEINRVGRKLQPEAFKPYYCVCCDIPDEWVAFDPNGFEPSADYRYRYATQPLVAGSAGCFEGSNPEDIVEISRLGHGLFARHAKPIDSCGFERGRG